jgi:hypothetical protein
VPPWELEDAPEHWMKKIGVVTRARRRASTHFSAKLGKTVSPDDFAEL